MESCTLCHHKDIEPISPPNDVRSYFFCNNCYLIFTAGQYHLTREEELERYSQHDNGLHNPGYVKFLNRVIMPSLKYLTEDMIGLDYGCGPTPTLSEILKQKGFNCYNYDPIFGFDHPGDKYDFIFCTECFEHFFQPSSDIKKITNLIKKGSILGIMTEQWESLERFNNWYYKRDLTHVSFFHQKSMEYVCSKFGFEPLYQDRNRVMIMKKL